MQEKSMNRKSMNRGLKFERTGNMFTSGAIALLYLVCNVGADEKAQQVIDIPYRELPTEVKQTLDNAILNGLFRAGYRNIFAKHNIQDPIEREFIYAIDWILNGPGPSHCFCLIKPGNSFHVTHFVYDESPRRVIRYVCITMNVTQPLLVTLRSKNAIPSSLSILQYDANMPWGLTRKHMSEIRAIVEK